MAQYLGGNILKISAIIIASGLSKRMGKNKLLLDFRGKEIYKHILDLVEKIDFHSIILVSSYDEILEYGKKIGFKSIFNENNQVGKSASIVLGVNNSDEDSALMFFVADQPLLTLKTTEKLIEEYEKNEYITYPKTYKRRGSPVIFSKNYRQGLLNLVGDQGGMLLVEDNPSNEVIIENEEELWDIDTVESYRKLKEKYE